ncbi:MAG: Arsenate reductase [Formosa sp. Hel1_33_131]|jgi:arsenate reductase|nr:MAG: Arsenate reductase [Formosa sp. Hel1_33_131]|tara:strand:- start:3157 stop:3498 length:342 start_codon:yes stop_codon:yes gene_type:complete
MIKIYHNNRCRKSREGLQIVQESGIDFEIVDYISNPLTATELKEVIAILNIAPIDLIRKNEAVWKSDYKNKALSDQDLIAAMAAHPKLIERPIIIHKNKGVIGRPKERILEVL